MRIKQIQGTNIKNQTFVMPLTGPVTIITGGNATGKSARLDAVRLATTGTTYGVGKKNADIMKIASAPSMTASIVTDDGVYGRGWERKGGRCTQQKTNPTLELPAALFDVGTFVRANDKTRIQMIGDATGQTEADPAILHDILGKHGLTTEAKGSGFFELATNIASELKDQISETRAHIDRMKKTILGTTALDDGGLAEKPDLEGAIKAQTDATNMLSQIRESAASNERNHAHRSRLQEHIDENPGEEDVSRARLTISEHSKRKERLNEKLAGLMGQQKTQNRIATENAVLGRGLEAAKEAEERAATDLKETEERIKELETRIQRLGDAESEFEEAKHTLRGLQSAADASVKAVELLSGEGDHCPCCGADISDDLKAQLIDSAQKKEHESLKAIQDLGMESSRDKRDELVTAKSWMEGLLQARESKTAELQAMVADRTKQEGLFRKPEDMAREANELAVAICDIEDQIAHSNDDTENAQHVMSMRRQAEQAAQAINDIRMSPYGAEDIPAAEERVKQAETRLAEVREEITKYEAAKADGARITKANNEIDDSTLKINMTKAASAQINKKHSEESARLLSGLIDTIGFFTKGALDGTVQAYGLEIGVARDEDWIPFEALSGSERVVVGTGIKAALATKAELRVIIEDEIGNLDRNRRAAFVKNCAEAAASGLIDNALLAGPDIDTNDLADIDGVEVHRIT